jgi:hypothetical protein
LRERGLRDLRADVTATEDDERVHVASLSLDGRC